MAKLFLFLAILASAAALFFGYEVSTKVSGVQDTIKNAKKEAADADEKVKKANDEAAKIKQQAASANDLVSQANAAKASAEQAAEAATTKLTDAQKQIDDLNAQVQKMQQTGTNPTAPTPPSADVVAMSGSIKDLQAQVAEAKQVAQAAQAKQQESDAKVAGLQKQVNAHAGAVARAGLEGQVMAVNQGWNFAVISLGDRQGVSPNSQLIVKRGDTMVGKLRISSVEPSTSIADIIPGSLRKGERVLPGDRVIFTVEQEPAQPQLPQQ